ncbi:hypothetical protein CDAR_75981 [Caerostris darwini]|uniref:Uncharacterized protein n=1 Tax=Caerostris darwini TaxID=1538125 RepID=A0AAV4Q8S0_9ARAC|nr:hypothetical protein CDAR_75981 [Caerostris darwini]
MFRSFKSYYVLRKIFVKAKPGSFDEITLCDLKDVPALLRVSFGQLGATKCFQVEFSFAPSETRSPERMRSNVESSIALMDEVEC